MAQIVAPKSVEIGETMSITWQGEVIDGTIELVQSDGTSREKGTRRAYLSKKKTPQTVEMAAPVYPGEYGLALVRKGQREREHLTVTFAGGL